MRPTYGSALFDLVDHPLNSTTILDIYAATVEALSKWEPRIIVEKVKSQTISPGNITISLQALYIPTGQSISLEGIRIK